MTNNDSTLSQCLRIFLMSISVLILKSPSGFCFDLSSDEVAVTNPTASRGAPTSNESSNEIDVRRIHVLQVPAQQLNFKYSGFKTNWLTSQSDWKKMWENSRTESDAPSLPINWKNESVLSIFWASKDAVVRIPAFSGSEVIDADGVKTLRLYFNLNTPCFGIISDVSPAQLIVMDHGMADIDRVLVSTATTRSTGCY